jgi:ankyrin repeat protein
LVGGHSFRLEGLNLFAAAERGLQDPGYKQRLAALGDVNQRGENGSTPLMAAAHETDLAWVKALLEAGADPKAKSKLDWTALKVAAVYGTGDVVDLLITAVRTSTQPTITAAGRRC